MTQPLSIYANNSLEVGKLYTTIVVDNTYFPEGEIYPLVNESNQVIGFGKVTKTTETNFDRIGHSDLKNMANIHMRSWGNAAEYFSIKFGKLFTYDGSIQLVNFEVISFRSNDVLLTETVEDEVMLGLPSDAEMGIETIEE